MRLLTWLARRFVAGETAEEALSVVAGLNSRGLKTTLDFLGEDCVSERDAEKAAEEYRALLKGIADRGVDSNVSLKLTQLGLGLGEGLAQGLLEKILDEAARWNNFVRIDMEGSSYTQKTLDLFKQVFARRKNVGVVIQACLRRSKKDVEDLIALGARVRLCKGAYKESVEAAFQDKNEVDRNYDELARRLLEAPIPAFATHDDERIRRARDAAAERGVDKGRYEVQMLYGLRPRRWSELLREGHVVRIYVPYGTRWLSYYWRRIRERKENLVFVLKGIFN